MYVHNLLVRNYSYVHHGLNYTYLASCILTHALVRTYVATYIVCKGAQYTLQYRY